MPESEKPLTGVRVVYVPGASHTVQDWKPLVDRLAQDLGGDWRGFSHNIDLLSFRDPVEVARELSAFIAAFDLHSPAPLILVGHSAGGLFTRAAYLMSAGALGMGLPSSTWHWQVNRIVLLASMDRGVRSDGSLRAKLGTPLIHMLAQVRKPLVYHFFKGAEFITHLRISWIRYFRTLDKPPQVCQLIGTRDDEVFLDDCLDSEQFPYARIMAVPGAGHVKLHNLSSTANPELHYQVIRDGFTASTASPPILQAPQPKKRVVILLHGIRASAMDWPRRLKQIIERNDPSTMVVMPSYGYFSARRFALPKLHRKPLTWFQDAYSQAVADHPNADISFVGHSNGTYLAGESLKNIPSLKFSRMFLGGCVLPTDFPWQEVGTQAGTIVNAFCHSDRVVALLCNALRGAGRLDLGTAGFEGFQTLASHQYVVDKGHGAAFDSNEDLQEVVAFILQGNIASRDPTDPPPHVRQLSRLMSYVWIPVVLLLAVVLIGGFLTPIPWLGLVLNAVIVFAVLLFLEIL